MFSLTPSSRYYLYQGHVNMNLGINGLFNLIRSRMNGVSPVSGDVFVFFGRNRRGVKLLKWDGDGFLLYYKRLERGTFEVPLFNPASGKYELSWKSFSLIMEGVSLESVRIRKRLVI